MLLLLLRLLRLSQLLLMMMILLLRTCAGMPRIVSGDTGDGPRGQTLSLPQHLLLVFWPEAQQLLQLQLLLLPGAPPPGLLTMLRTRAGHNISNWPAVCRGGAGCVGGGSEHALEAGRGCCAPTSSAAKCLVDQGAHGMGACTGGGKGTLVKR